MTNRKSTKKALLVSGMSLLICFTMLIGTTFAWFTDSVTSANNIIKSGNLDIELEYAVFNDDGTFKEWKDVKEASDILTNTLWEPGVTEVAYLRLANAGSLALKYQLGVNIVSESGGINVDNQPFMLSDHIDFGVVELNTFATYATREDAVADVTNAKKINEGFTKASDMEAGDELYLALVVYMPTTVGNEANYKTDTAAPQINLGINVVATQMTYEEDSFGNDYDASAPVPVVSMSEKLVDSSDNATDVSISSEKVSVEIPSDVSELIINNTTTESVAIRHTTPVMESGKVIIDSCELVDDNGIVIDLEALENDKPISVTLALGDGFEVGETVKVYHDGVLVASPAVSANKTITYEVVHFCEIEIVPNVAKVGNTFYETIDDAIANWTNNTTLTLLKDVTLSDVITIKSTEHHILDLGTKTMTAASGKNAIVIKACGTGDAERTAITIKADATNPGGIDAGKKSVIYYKYADGGISGNDRPIIKIEGGVFTGATSSIGTAGIYTIGTAARKCATLNVTGGTFNCSINGSGKSKLLISGGTFNYSVGSQGDSTALRLISGGKFKTLGFMTADSNNTKFWFGTSMANSNVGLYIDREGYLVVGGPVITEENAGDRFEAVASNCTKWSSYLQYSSAKDNGLYYEDAAMAVKKHGESNVTIL